MTGPILTYTLPAPEVDRAEVLRYARGDARDPQTLALLDRLLEAALPTLTYRAAVRRVSLAVTGDAVTLGPLTVTSHSLAAHLGEARSALLLAATVGAGMDRLLLRYARTSPASALLLEGLGAERVEALLASLDLRLKEDFGRTTRRFSPGYGDLPLSLQGGLFSLLDCERLLGLTLGESLLMTPKKSVTAILGLLD